eukprot:m.53296 g.53296  ORF g.53296 m.53296 type:complete len:218 (-) comp7443_c0_seq1:265-918(-)
MPRVEDTAPPTALHATHVAIARSHEIDVESTCCRSIVRVGHHNFDDALRASACVLCRCLFFSSTVGPWRRSLRRHVPLVHGCGRWLWCGSDIDSFCNGDQRRYIARPVLFLAARSRWGDKSWWPWLIALLSESASLGMLQQDDGQGMTEAEKAEVSRRYSMLLLYAVRSPAFEQLGDPVMTTVFEGVRRNIGLTSIVDASESYARYCQRTYSYVWAT